MSAAAVRSQERVDQRMFSTVPQSQDGFPGICRHTLVAAKLQVGLKATAAASLGIASELLCTDWFSCRSDGVSCPSCFFHAIKC